MVENLNARQGAGLPQPPGQGDVVDARSGVTLYGWLWKGTMAAARRVAAVRKTSRGWTRLASSVPVDTISVRSMRCFVQRLMMPKRSTGLAP